MMTTNYARGLMNNVMERAKNKNFREHGCFKLLTITAR